MTALTQRIVSEIESSSEPVQAEVLDFLLFVKARAGTTPVPGSSGRILHTPGVCGGEACIGMTRVAVWILEEARRAGVGDLELLKDYPGISVFDLEPHSFPNQSPPSHGAMASAGESIFHTAPIPPMPSSQYPMALSIRKSSSH